MTIFSAAWIPNKELGFSVLKEEEK